MDDEKAFYEHIKLTNSLLKNSVGEKTIIEYLIGFNGNKMTLKSVGYVKDINAKFKNEFFEEIYENENGEIVDVIPIYNKPTIDDINKRKEYWKELYNIYNKTICPCFIIGE